MRFKMYVEDYGHERVAMENDAAMDASRTASACASCAGPCVGACPFGLNVRRDLARAHDLLRVV